MTHCPTGRRSKTRSRRNLRMESLESRNLMAVFSSVNDSGILVVQGDADHNYADVRVEGEEVVVYSQTNRLGTGPEADWHVTAFPLSSVQKVYFLGEGGDDMLLGVESIPNVIYGGEGADYIWGGALGDYVYGGEQDDEIYGGGGADYLYGEGGNDRLIGDAIQEGTAAGADTIDGGSGNDHIWGDNGANDLGAGFGAGDRIYGGAGNDIIEGQGGRNVIFGGIGNDELYGGEDIDHIQGDDGSDTIFGFGGDDRLEGDNSSLTTGSPVTISLGLGSYNDLIYGGSGADMMFGQRGDDYLEGGDQADSIFGGVGLDTILGGSGRDILSGGAGNDVMDGGMDRDTLYGEEGNDELWGNRSNDLSDWDADDTIYGGAGNDILYGGAGQDQLFGNAGFDFLYGEDENDKLWGGADVDWLYGGDGDDFLDAGAAYETADGGQGLDFNAFITAVNGARYWDISQGSTGTCFVLAPMASIASKGVDLSQKITYLGDGNYNVSLFQKNFVFVPGAGLIATPAPVNVVVAFNGDLLPTDAASHYRSEGESWVTIMQRALVQLLNINVMTVTGGSSDPVIYALTGKEAKGVAATRNHINLPNALTTADRTTMEKALQAGKLVLADTRANAWNMPENKQFPPDHVYAVLSINAKWGTSGLVYSVSLYNPWGTDMNAREVANGRATASGANDDGVVTVSWDVFARNFDGYATA